MAQALEAVRRERDEAESSVEEMRSKVFRRKYMYKYRLLIFLLHKNKIATCLLVIVLSIKKLINTQ